ncbi:unnamed protein product [Mytilus edulis]|uniref:Tyr recombinase domain-containing protein n=1 Tax=Mytilus edulis TaxID=6550 RepID=A0A8S3UC85_MYTED|nr:unnamed protein product [Mytilus edulis]
MIVIKDNSGNCISLEDSYKSLTEEGRRLTNHSARRYLLQKLSDEDISDNKIMQISGHKNIASINEYRKINNEQHQQISGLLNKTKPVKRAAPVESENRPPNCEVQFQQSEAQAFPLSQSSTAMSYRLGSATTNSTSNISSIFGGNVYGGNFTINVYSPSEAKQSRLDNHNDAEA